MKNALMLLIFFTLSNTSALQANARGFSSAMSLEDCSELAGPNPVPYALCILELTRKNIARCNSQCCLPAEPYLVRYNNGFGLRTKPTRGNHKGIDFSYNWPVYHERVAETGRHPIAKVRAALEGKVVTKGNCGSGFGNCIEISHKVNGRSFKTRYAHLKRNCKVYENLRIGQVVGSGDVIACMGNTGRSTGPHLHFEVLNAQNVQVDPQRFCRFSDEFLNYESFQ